MFVVSEKHSYGDSVQFLEPPSQMVNDRTWCGLEWVDLCWPPQVPDPFPTCSEAAVEGLSLESCPEYC